MRPSLIQLMLPVKLSAQAWSKLGPEDQLSIQFANLLRAYAMDGQLQAVWTHPANEVGGGQKNAALRYAIAKSMGMIPGTPDFLFLWNTGAGALEAKVEGRYQTENQRFFEDWCRDCGVPYAVFRTVEEGMSNLRAWGVLI